MYSDNSRKEQRPPRPFWLAHKIREGSSQEDNNYVIDEKDIEAGLDRHEHNSAAAGKGTRRNGIASMNIKPDFADYGEFIGYYAFSQLTNVFNVQRRSTTHTFGEMLGYLFTEWGEEWRRNGIRKDSLSISWNCTNRGRSVKVKDIPRTSEVCRVAMVNGKSAKKFIDFVNERYNLQLVICHDVYISDMTVDEMRKGKGGRRFKDNSRHYNGWKFQ